MEWSYRKGQYLLYSSWLDRIFEWRWLQTNTEKNELSRLWNPYQLEKESQHSYFIKSGESILVIVEVDSSEVIKALNHKSNDFSKANVILDDAAKACVKIKQQSYSPHRTSNGWVLPRSFFFWDFFFVNRVNRFPSSSLKESIFFLRKILFSRGYHSFTKMWFYLTLLVVKWSYFYLKNHIINFTKYRPTN